MSFKFLIFFLLYSLKIEGTELPTPIAPLNKAKQFLSNVADIKAKMTALKKTKDKVAAPAKADEIFAALKKANLKFAASEKTQDKSKCVDYKYAFFCCPPKGKGRCIPYEQFQPSKKKCCKDAENEGDCDQGSPFGPFVIPPWYPPLLPIYTQTPCPTPSSPDAGTVVTTGYRYPTRRGDAGLITVDHSGQRPNPPLPPLPPPIVDR